jgi:hypothetical protein
MDNTPSQRWWKRPPVRLTVRTLMIFVLVFAAGLGLVVHRAQVQRDAVAAIERAGGVVVYEWQMSSVGTKLAVDRKANPPWPKWLVKLMGVDYFGHVKIVALGDQATDAVMEHLGRLPRLEGFVLDGRNEVTDAGLSPLRELTELNEIRLTGSKMTEACLANIQRLPRLKNLELVDIPLTDAALVRLKAMTGLRQLWLTRTQITKSGIAELQRSLPTTNDLSGEMKPI